MREHLLEPYESGTSLLHRAPAGAKLAAALVLLAGLVLVPRGAWGVFASVAAGLAAMVALSRVPPARLALRVLALEPFALGVAVLALAQPDGVAHFAHLVVRSTLSLGTLVLLAATTRFTDVLAVLRALRVPALLVTTLALLHRYLFLLAEEARRLDRARASRTFVSGRSARWRGAAGAVAQLFVRASVRAERVHDAMVSRGWRS